MLDHLGNMETERKCRLCSVAFCQRLKPHLFPESVQSVLEVAARFADGLATEDEREAAWQLVATSSPMSGPLHMIAIGQTSSDIDFVIENLAWGGSELEPEDELAVQAAILRDIFGNPFRPVTFSPAWLTDTGVALARQMYESREFSAMPILADALQDAGCDTADILDHCRDTQLTHARGCWVIDRVLGKT